MIVRTVAAAVLLATVTGCDPLLVYVPSGAPQRKGVEGDGVSARFQGSIFTISGDVDVEVDNRSDAGLAFAPTPTSIRDADGRMIATEWCAYSTGNASTVIKKGEQEKISCRFHVDVVGFFRPYPRAVQRLALSQPGFTQQGRALPISGTLEAK